MTVNAKQFEELVGSQFTADIDGKTLGLSLDSVEIKESTPTSERFALMFTSDGSEDKGQPVPQQTLSMRNDTLGQLNIFVVPVAQKDGKFFYEAVFNRREG